MFLQDCNSALNYVLIHMKEIIQDFRIIICIEYK